MLEKFKTWCKTKLWPWFKKSWMQIVNYLVIFIAYSKVYQQPGFTGVEFVLGVWLFTLTAYYLFLETFGAEKLFPKKPQ